MEIINQHIISGAYRKAFKRVGNNLNLTVMRKIFLFLFVICLISCKQSNVKETNKDTNSEDQSDTSETKQSINKMYTLDNIKDSLCIGKTVIEKDVSTLKEEFEKLKKDEYLHEGEISKLNQKLAKETSETQKEDLKNKITKIEAEITKIQSQIKLINTQIENPISNQRESIVSYLRMINNEYTSNCDEEIAWSFLQEISNELQEKGEWGNLTISTLLNNITFLQEVAKSKNCHPLLKDYICFYTGTTDKDLFAPDIPKQPRIFVPKSQLEYMYRKANAGKHKVK